MNRNIQIVYKKDNGADEKTYYIDKHKKWLPQEFELDMILVQEQADEKERKFVEVVRCGDCRYKDTEDCPATERRMYRNNIGVIKEFLETWCGMEFCSNGKRRAK